MINRPSISVTFQCFLHHLIICRLTPLSMAISMQRSTHLILSCRLVVFIDTTSIPISRLPYLCFLTPIYLTSCQAQQIFTSHASPNLLASTSHTFFKSLAFIFHGRFFYILSHILAYVQDFPMGQDYVYIYENVVKQGGTIFELRSAFASGLVKAIKKDKSWALATCSESKLK